MAKTRLDLLLVARGLAESRTKAQALIMAGLVYHGEQKLDKAGAEFADDLALTVRGREHPWVSRGGMKLAHAIEQFDIQVRGAVAMDVGASTGGFTDVLLTHGAAKIYAVDVGHGQLDVKLRNDRRVVVMENTNARHLTAAIVQAAELAGGRAAGALPTEPPALIEGESPVEPPALIEGESPPSRLREGLGEGKGLREARPSFGQARDSTRQRTALHHAKELRKNPTEAEKKLWSIVRTRQCGGARFRRQQAIGPYIVDFVNIEARLILELDGGQHAQQVAYDAERTSFLKEAGYRVVRYWNHEVLQNPEGVFADILKQLTMPCPFPPPTPPAGGRGVCVSVSSAGVQQPPVPIERESPIEPLALIEGESPPSRLREGLGEGNPLDLIVCDASFISLTKVLPAALALAKPGAQLVALIKPQFEVGKAEVSRGKGVIRDPALHRQVCADISAWVAALGWQVVGISQSPITGPKGNVEFLLYARKGE